MSKNLILITGRNRAGKTTLANWIRDEIPKTSLIPFAKALKDELVNCGFPYEFLAEKSQEARRLMQAYGDAKRKLDPEYFLTQWERSLFNNGEDFVVADDMYHWKELHRAIAIPVKRFVILVLRPLPQLTEEDLKYASVRESVEMMRVFLNLDIAPKMENKFMFSKEFDSFMMFVANDQTLEEYEQKVKEIIIPQIKHLAET